VLVCMNYEEKQTVNVPEEWINASKAFEAVFKDN